MAAEEKLTRAEQAEVTRRGEEDRYFRPAADIVETAQAVIVTLDMPGVAKESVDITVDKDMLTVVGRADPEEPGEVVYRETHIGDYQRQFTLSSDVDPQKISATMNAGVLTVEIGKAERARPRKIEITAAQ